MGLLDWFRRRRTIPITCWLDEPSRLRGFTRGVSEDLTRQDRVIVVAHFKDALVTAGQHLANAGIAFETRDRWLPVDTQNLLAGPGPVVATLARALPDLTDVKQRPSPAANATRVALRVFDLHVLADENARIMGFAQGLPSRSRISASVSFDDPVMRTFASPWVKTMMSTLGLKEDQSIESPMVSRALHRALQKLAKKATGNVPCDSIEEWMRRNLPQ